MKQEGLCFRLFESTLLRYATVSSSSSEPNNPAAVRDSLSLDAGTCEKILGQHQTTAVVLHAPAAAAGRSKYASASDSIGYVVAAVLVPP